LAGLVVAGASWVVLLVFLFQIHRPSQWPWIALFVALSFVAIGLFWMRLTRTERLALERSAELQKANEALRQEIRERVKVEESLRSVTQQLSQTQEKTRLHLRFVEALLNTIPSPVFLKDHEQKYLLTNAAFAEQVLGGTLNKPLEKQSGTSLPCFPRS